MTNIGISHIENLKTQENIMAEKLHITDAFTEDSVLFLNADDPLLFTISKWDLGKAGSPTAPVKWLITGLLR